jgi:WD40 repeat protein
MSHRSYAHGVSPQRPLLWLITFVVACGTMPAVAKVETWRQEGPAAFAKCRREGVVISDSGRVRLGHALSSFGSLAAERVWDLAQTPDGVLYAATGDAGKVFRREAKGDAAWTVAYDSKDTQVLSLAVLPDGTVYAGTGPHGQIVNLSDPKHPASSPDPKVQYIWDLAADAHGNLYAATGPDGQLWKRPADGVWSLSYDSKATHLLCLAIGPGGVVFVGGDGEGLIYRVSPDGKTTILFDAPQSEVRTLLWGPDGALYAGTATEASGANTARGSLFVTQGGGMPRFFDGAGTDRGVDAPSHGGDDGPVDTVRVQAGGLAQARPAAPRPLGGGSAAPKPISAGDNAVYRLDNDGVPREVLRVKALVHALVWADNRLLVGTGPEGQLYEVRDRGEETAPIAKLDSGQILALLVRPDGALVIGTGDPGSVVQVAPGYAAAGTLLSEVHDTKLVSRFGSLSWRADLPPRTSIAFETRTGNVGEPDETWSPWSATQSSPGSGATVAPLARFIQYRAKLTTADPRRTPDLRSVSLSYRTSNLAPEISRLDVPDLSTADGAARQTRLNLRWDANDPNDDELSFTLKARKDGWPEWIDLTDEPITEKTFAWDTTAFPSGSYRLKLVASDRLSNSPDDVLTRERESLSFIVDHDSPAVTVTARKSGADIMLKDEQTRLVKADYALDGGRWVPIFPDDGLFDTVQEKITLALPDLKPGVHLVMVRATDSAGNVGAGDALIEVKK